jgi:argininosuccinate lyase
VGSLIHVDILKQAGLLNKGEAKRLQKALKDIYKSIKKGTFRPDMKSEDIHTNIQNMVEKKAGKVAMKLHTSRSRNDQVLFATKLYTTFQLSHIIHAAKHLVDALTAVAQRNRNIIIPGFTHLQHAQPVYLKDHLNAYVRMLKRDIARLKNTDSNISLTMGAGALAGTPIDQAMYNKKAVDLKESVTPSVNSLDDVSNRDFVIEALSSLAIIGMHLSRMAEDLIIWSTKEFGFVEIDDAYCTGSSLMPQKKNPDVLELIRGYSGKLSGNLLGVMVTMKGLPLTYNRDMQLDKEPLFGSFELVSDELKVLTGLVRTLRFNKKKIYEHLKDESLYATYLAHYLVKKGVPFTRAHSIVGRLIKYSAKNSLSIKGMSQKELERFSDKFNKRDIEKLLNPYSAIRTIKSIKR